jgi:basic amino acid/polyamine antiporter, APA family
MFFRAFSAVHPTYSTPSNSILLLSVWSSLLVLTGRYEQLYTMVIFPSWILYAMATAAVIVLRRTRPDLPRPYKTIGYPIVPVLFVLVAIALIVSTLFNSPRESVLGLGIIAVGIPFYRRWRLKTTR